MNLIQTETLTKTFGDGSSPVQALRGVNLTVADGEFVAIMGPSGSGKSTLLYLLGGLEKPSQGKVKMGDADLSALDDEALSRLRRTKIGFVFQFFNLIPVLTARENVAIPLILDGVKRADALQRADEALSQVGLKNRATHRPSELSGGEQQRVALARALVTKPALILGDEPTGNLDSQSSEEIVQLLRKATDEWGRTIVLVTHDPRIAAYADRIVFLKDGQIVDENKLKGQGNAEEIRARLGKVAVG
jgi:putative ABC transport system ATP-binding protein